MYEHQQIKIKKEYNLTKHLNENVRIWMQKLNNVWQ